MTHYHSKLQFRTEEPKPEEQSQSFISAYIDIQNTVITDPDNGTSSYPVEAAIMYGCRIADYTLQPNHEASSSAYLCMPGFCFAHVVMR